jgi:2-iminobutanoate/2-iminopropanoate deaminase
VSKPVFHVFDGGPEMVAPYSHAVEVGDLLFVTGQMPILPDGSAPEGIEAQTEAIFANLRQVMERAGFAGGTVVNARVFLTRFEAHYERMNAVYAKQFAPGELPSRTCVGVTGLARDCDIEIDLVVSRT